MAWLRASRRLSIASGVIATLVALLLLVPRALEPRDFSSDEAAKISETFYYRLLIEGRFSDRAWFAPDVERANPPIGKYVFGLVARAAGAPLALDPVLHQDATGRYVPPPGREVPFRRALVPARIVSACCMALAIGIVVWMAAELEGRLAALLAFPLFSRHYLTPTLAMTAVFDGLQVLFIVAAIALLAFPRERIVPRAAVAGVVIALAFQTRLNGILAIVPAMLFVAFQVDVPWRKRNVAMATMLAACGVVSVAVNPFYWAAGRDGSTLPWRIAQRVQGQFRDAHTIVSTYGAAMRPGGFVAKSRFALRVFGSGIAGKATLIGVLLAAVASIRRRELRAYLVAVAAFTIVFVLWLPLFWDRYLFPPLPLLAVVAAVGWTWCAQALAARLHHT